MTIKISVSQLEDLAIEGESDDGKLRVVKEGRWVSDGKYESKTIVFTDGDRNYRGYVMRSGSYYSDYSWSSEWDNGEADIEEVAEVPVTTTEWQTVLGRGFHVYETEYPSEGSYCISVEEFERRISDEGEAQLTVIEPAVLTSSGWYPRSNTKEAV